MWEENPMETNNIYRVYNWIGGRVRWVAVAVLLVAIGLGVAGPMIANTDEPNFDPDGEIFMTLEDVDATLGGDSTIRIATWLVESRDEGANVLNKRTLGEWLDVSEAVRADAEHSSGWCGHRLFDALHCSFP
jgi:hypothetical protein